MLEITAPAKLNLMLRILGRRDDGYHEIDTTMVRLDGLCDRLQFSHADRFALHCDCEDLPTDEGNLVVRAVRAYERAGAAPCRYRIDLEKNIPHGAGLGGGSSDAASTLMALDQLNPEPLGRDRLMDLAAELGSDVPFFLGTGCAQCTGRGERIVAVQPPSFPLRLMLLKPWFSVSTPDAYRRWSASMPLAGVPYGSQDLAGWELRNDLERAVFEKHRFLAEMKCWLLQRDEVIAAQMCGSGSTMFAVLNEGAKSGDLERAALAELDPNLWTWHGTQTF